MKGIRNVVRGLCTQHIHLVLIFVYCIGIHHGVEGQHFVDELYNTMFGRYIKEVKPQCRADDNVTFTLDMSLRQIIELNEPKQLLSINVWMRMRWTDCRLSWDPNNYSSVDALAVPRTSLWIPDLTLYDNSAESNLAGIKDYTAKINNNGTIQYNFPSVITSLCSIDVRYFPFDVQSCPLEFGSWAYDGNSLDIYNFSDKIGLDSFVESIEWGIDGVPIHRKVVHYDDVPYPTVIFTINLRRKPLFYITNILAPCLLITFVAVFGFMLPPDSGEKVSLAITVLLSLAVFQLVVLETIPASGESTPFIAIYFMSCMAIVGMSCLMTVIVLQIHYKGHSGMQMPRWVKHYIMRNLSRVTFVKMDVLHTPKTPTSQQTFSYKIPNGSTQYGSQAEIKANSCVVTEETDTGKTFIPGDTSQIAAMKLFHPLQKILNEITSSLRTVEDYVQHQAEAEAIQDEWSLLAIMMDRLMMVVYLFVTTTVTLALLLPVVLM